MQTTDYQQPFLVSRETWSHETLLSHAIGNETETWQSQSHSHPLSGRVKTTRKCPQSETENPDENLPRKTYLLGVNPYVLFHECLPAMSDADLRREVDRERLGGPPLGEDALYSHMAKLELIRRLERECEFF